MYKWSIIILVPFGLFACRETKEKTVEANRIVFSYPHAKEAIVFFSTIDSLEKYTGTDSMVIEDVRLNTSLFIGRLNQCDIGVQWFEHNLNVVFFQKINEKWIADTTVFYFETCYVKTEDMNGDQIEDMIVYSPSGSAGNLQNQVYLFHPSKRKFIHNPEYDLENVQYDTENHFLRSWRYAGVVHCQTKEKYVIKGEHVVFEGGITYCPDDETMGETGKLEYYTQKGDEKVVTKTVAGKFDKLYKIFDATFWDSKELYP
jgi:hypothetical protein